MNKIKILFLSAFLFFTSSSFYAQDDDGPSLTLDKTNIFQAGISFGHFGYGYLGSRSFTIPLSVSYEKYFVDYISVGGFMGFARYSYDYGGGNYAWTYFNIGPRGSYHYLEHLNEALDTDIDTEMFDFYVSLMFILEFGRYSSDYEDYTFGYDNDFGVHIGPVAGFRYKLSDSFALFFEGGRGTFGFGTLGASVHF
jgi:hypothetical protein